MAENLGGHDLFADIRWQGGQHLDLLQATLLGLLAAAAGAFGVAASVFSFRMGSIVFSRVCRVLRVSVSSV